MFLPLFYYFEILAFITSAVFLFKANNSSLRWFPFFLFFIVAVEFTAMYIRQVLHQPNVWLYNFSIPVEYLFFGLIFFANLQSPSNRYLARWFLILFAGFAIFNIAFIQGLGKFNSNIVLTGSFFMILLSALMLFEIYLKDQSHTIWIEPLFWIAAGVLLFNAGEFTYNLLSHYLINKEIDKAAQFFASINNKLIFVLYSFLTIGFICSKTTEILKKA